MNDFGFYPQAGSQMQFIACPLREVLYHGTRGNGKTIMLLMDFLQHVGQGFGADWRGILFRETFPQLEDVISKARKWFPLLHPSAVYNKADYSWEFEDGEKLLLRHIRTPDDYWNFHGHEYPWIGWEELPNWATGECYHVMKSCNRSSAPGMPRKYRATGNPWGPGHGWVKAYFIDPAKAGAIYQDKENGWQRTHIKGDISENKILTSADPEYLNTLDGIEDENLKKAWRFGDWDIAAGGIFTDVYDPTKHVISPFKIPANWEITRSFDWGSSRPFSVGWWAQANGERVDGARQFAKGTWIRIDEWYGWNGKPNEGCRMLAAEIAKGIKEREKERGWNVTGGVADSAIFDVGSGLSRESIASEMASLGVRWTPANKGPGSRVQGWEKVRELFVNARKTPMESPGLVVFDICRQFIRTMPTLLRDEKKPDDIDTRAEDHCLDSETSILTDSGCKTIKEMVGTTGFVLSHLGRWRRYYDVRMTRKLAPCIKVTLDGSSHFICTPEHRVWTGSQWNEAQHLIGCGRDEARYLYNYDKNNITNDSGVPGGKVLPLWKVFSAEGVEAAQNGLVRQQRGNTNGLPRPSCRRGHPQQPLVESVFNPGDGALLASRLVGGEEGDIKKDANDAIGPTVCRDLAQIGEGLGVARETGGDAECAAGEDDGVDVHILPSGILAFSKDAHPDLLRGQLQGGGEAGKWRGSCSQDLPILQKNILGKQVLSSGVMLKSLRCGVAKIEVVEPRDVYNLEVDDDHSFTLANGVSVHNCADEVRYRLTTNIPKAGAVSY